MNRKTLLLTIMTLVLLTTCVNPKGKSSEEMNTNATTTSTWIKIDDFEAQDAMAHWTLADTRNDTYPRIEHPQVTAIRSEANGANHYLIKKPAAEGIIGNRKALSYRKLPRVVAVGETYTFYIRFNVEYFPNNHVFGWSNLLPEEINQQDYNAFEPSLRVTDKYESDGTKNDGRLMVRKEGGYDKISNPQTDTLAEPLETDTWYEAWCVVNNATEAEGGQHYDVYLRGGTEFPQQQQVYAAADFRIKRAQPLIYFLANCNTGPVENPYGNGGLRYDDMYMAEGELLSTPLDQFKTIKNL